MSSMKSTRRRFIGASAAVAGTVALQACGATPPAAAPTAASGSATTVAQKPAASAVKTVSILTPATWAQLGQTDATAILNNEVRDQGIQYTIEESATGWEQKALAMIKDKSLPWSGMGEADSSKQYSYIKSGMAQPIDDYLKQSKVPWAKDMKSTWYAPNIEDVNKFEGKYYMIPMKLNIHMMGYRLDYLQQTMKLDTMPDTWDEVERVLMELKKALSSQNVLPWFMTNELWRTLGTAYASRKEGKIYDDTGLILLDTPEFYDTINMYNRWAKAGLFTKDSYGADKTIWDKGKVFGGLDSHSWVRSAKKIWGMNAVKGQITPQPKKTDKPKTWIHIDSGFLFAGAPNPQEAVDWLLAVHGPEGKPAERWWSSTITFSGSPAHKTMYDKYIAKNTDYPEIAESYKTIAGSDILPVSYGYSYNAIQSKIWPWMEKFWFGTISDKEAMTNVLAEVKDELAKGVTIRTTQ
jgi:ABC-type glycerol-3-phosphate transport system substrate-binding protein